MAIAHTFVFLGRILELPPRSVCPRPIRKVGCLKKSFPFKLFPVYKLYLNICLRINIDGRNSFITGFGRCLYRKIMNQKPNQKKANAVKIRFPFTASPTPSPSMVLLPGEGNECAEPLLTVQALQEMSPSGVCAIPSSSSLLSSGGARLTSASQIKTTPRSGLSSAENTPKGAW